MLDKVYVIGYYGYGSLGDEAMRFGLAEILETKGYYNVKFHRKGLGYIKNFIWADTIVIGGGTHLRDWGKNWFKQFARIILLGLITRLCGKQFCMLNVGIENNTMEFIAKNIANHVTVRDDETFDSSVVLNYTPKIKKKIIGVSLASVYETYYNNKIDDIRLATNLAKEIRRWMYCNDGWEVHFFNFNSSDEELNRYCATLLENATIRNYVDDAELILSEISECSAFISMRYHGCQFAYKTETPLFIINSYPSCRKLADYIGLKAIDKDDILAGKFILEFNRANLDLNMAKSLAFKGVEL